MLGLDLGLWPMGAPGGPVAPPPPPQAGGSAFAYNLGFARHYSSNRPFLNLIKLAQYWKANNGASVPLDGDAYPTAIPAGASYLFANLFVDEIETDLLSNDIHVFWDGDGVVTLGDGGVVTLTEPNHFVYTPTDGSHRFDMTDFGTTGVRNMRVVRDDHLALLNSGEVYHPDWLAIVSKSRMLRFLNWLTVNSANDEQLWANRPTESRFSYLFRMPYEIVIDICNRAGADLWIQTGHRVDQALVEGLAALVRDTLDPALTCFVEYSNETWNNSFDQAQYFIAKGVEDWGTQIAGTVSLVKGEFTVNGVGTSFLTDLSPAPLLVAADGQLIEVASIQSDTQYTTSRVIRKDATDAPIFVDDKYQRRSAYVKHATQFAKWWQAIHPTRCKHLLGAQGSAGNDVQSLIDASDWQTNEPLNWEQRNVTFDGIAVTIYYGSNLTDSTLIAELNAARATSEAAMLAVLDGHLRDPGEVTSLAGLSFKLREHHRACRAAGLDLYAYEGGSHIVHPGGALTEQERNDLLDHFITWVNSDDFTVFNTDLLNVSKSFIDGPFMQFDAVSRWANTVAWGAYQSPIYAGDKRTEFLDALSTAGRFWGDDIAPQNIKSLPDITGTEFLPITLTRLDTRFTANTLTFTAEGLPEGLAVDPVTGDITGSPGEGAAGAGTYTITGANAVGSVQASGSYDIAAHVPIDPLTITGARVYDLTDGSTLSATTSPAAFGLPPGQPVAEIMNIGDATGFNMVFDSGASPIFNGDGVTWSDKGVFLSAPVPITNEERSMFVAARLTSDGGWIYGGQGGTNRRTFINYTTASPFGRPSGGFGDDGSNPHGVSVKDVNAVIGFIHDGVRNKVYLNGDLVVDNPAAGTCGTLADNGLGTFVGTSGPVLSLGFEGKVFAVIDIPGIATGSQIYDINNWLTSKMS